MKKRSFLCPSCNVWEDYWTDGRYPEDWYRDKALREHMDEKHD